MATSEEIIREYTDGKIRAMSFDIENALDISKYSAWVSALATGGIAIELSNFQKIMAASFLVSRVAFAFLLTAAALLFGSLVVASVVTWRANEDTRYHRYRIMLYSKQRLELFCKPSVEADGRSLVLQFQRGDFLEPKDRAKFKNFKRTGWVRRLVPLLIAQQALTAAGYAALFVASIPAVH